MPELEYLDARQARRRKAEKPKKKLPARLLLALLVLAAALFGVLLSPVFTVKTITVTELDCYSKGEVLQTIGLSEGMNLFSFGAAKAEKTLKKDPYFEEVRISRKLPDTMVIDITERKICGYVPFLGIYLYIDAEGRVLDSRTAFAAPHPVVRGLAFDRFVLGEVLEADNADALAAVVQISRAIERYEMDELVLEVDVSNPKQLVMTVNKITATLGSNADIDEKIRILYQVAQSIPATDRGTVDLSDLTKPIIFKYTT